MSTAPSSEPWPQTEQALLRAERLLAHGLEGIRREQQLRRSDHDRIAFELEQLLPPLEGLSAALVEVIEAMAQARQDNQLQRWQGQLQQQLDPLDEGLRLLREQLVLLDQPLAHEQPEASSRRERQKQQQLVQLLAHRQKQVMALQAERSALRVQLFECEQRLVALAAGHEVGDLEASAGFPDQTSTPSIFS
jgi:small-conductance mechanosensitive channel